ncbi:MAG: DNA gyrase subunit A [Bacteroidetes bacterium]|nr:DNA gyrase subunit A [Bacteroidota bacterium]
MAEGEKIIPINIEEEMKTAYIDYSMSVIVSRALPDVRDGLKPVHRRVLYGMLDLGVLSNKPYKKSARIVGEVLGKYHPHGDSSVYDAMVRMAQEWSLRYPLVDGQGNYGSMDGDPPAAMRYTEARFRKLAEEMLADIDKDTVDMALNFDDSLKEPTVLPAKIPNLLMNGSSGIAVGMATNMPPHNLTEVIDGIAAYIANKEITVDELMKFIKAPDFPTAGIIYGYAGVQEALRTGRGKIVLRARAVIENHNGKDRIIVTEIPYQINKAEMIKRTADMVNEKKIEGITDIRDESDREGVRIVYELRRDAISNVVLNNLYKFTSLQSSFSVNNIALVHGRPMTLNLKDLIVHFVNHRHEVVIRRTKYELSEAEKRAHILEGLLIALDHLDEVIALIRASQTPDIARDGLMEKFGLSEIQSKAILEMRLQRLTGLERDKIKAEYKELMDLIEYYRDVLANEDLRMDIIKDELSEMKDKYGDARRTEIVYTGDEISMEDMIADEDVVITISHHGYIKRTALSEYRTQGRGGRGAKGSATREEDFVEHIFIASTHNYILYFTEQGKCYWMKVYEIPEGTKTSKGRAIQNLISLPPDDKVKAFINVKNLTDEEYINNNFIVMCTKDGTIKKTALEAYSRPRLSGINAINIEAGDQLLEVRLTNGKNEIMVATKKGKVVRFNEETVRAVGRNSIGVRGVTLDGADDFVIGMVCINDAAKETVLVVSEKGYGKRSDIDEYRKTNRGGKGVKTINITDKTGNLIAIKVVSDNDDLMIINKSGITIRMSVDELRVMGRATQGVRLIKLDDDDEIASVAKVEVEDEKKDDLIATSTDETIASAEIPDTDSSSEPTEDGEAGEPGSETNPEE